MSWMQWCSTTMTMCHYGLVVTVQLAQAHDRTIKKIACAASVLVAVSVGVSIYRRYVMQYIASPFLGHLYNKQLEEILLKCNSRPFFRDGVLDKIHEDILLDDEFYAYCSDEDAYDELAEEQPFHIKVQKKGRGEMKRDEESINKSAKKRSPTEFRIFLRLFQFSRIETMQRVVCHIKKSLGNYQNSNGICRIPISHFLDSWQPSLNNLLTSLDCALQFDVEVDMIRDSFWLLIVTAELNMRYDLAMFEREEFTGEKDKDRSEKAELEKKNVVEALAHDLQMVENIKRMIPRVKKWLKRRGTTFCPEYLDQSTERRRQFLPGEPTAEIPRLFIQEDFVERVTEILKANKPPPKGGSFFNDVKAMMTATTPIKIIVVVVISIVGRFYELHQSKLSRDAMEALTLTHDGGGGNEKFSILEVLEGNFGVSSLCGKFLASTGHMTIAFLQSVIVSGVQASGLHALGEKLADKAYLSLSTSDTCALWMWRVDTSSIMSALIATKAIGTDTVNWISSCAALCRDWETVWHCPLAVVGTMLYTSLDRRLNLAGLLKRHYSSWQSLKFVCNLLQVPYLAEFGIDDDDEAEDVLKGSNYRERTLFVGMDAWLQNRKLRKPPAGTDARAQLRFPRANMGLQPLPMLGMALLLTAVEQKVATSSASFAHPNLLHLMYTMEWPCAVVIGSYFKITAQNLTRLYITDLNYSATLSPLHKDEAQRLVQHKATSHVAACEALGKALRKKRRSKKVRHQEVRPHPVLSVDESVLKRVGNEIPDIFEGDMLSTLRASAFEVQTAQLVVANSSAKMISEIEQSIEKAATRAGTPISQLEHMCKAFLIQLRYPSAKYEDIRDVSRLIQFSLMQHFYRSSPSMVPHQLDSVVPSHLLSVNPFFAQHDKGHGRLHAFSQLYEVVARPRSIDQSMTHSISTEAEEKRAKMWAVAQKLQEERRSICGSFNSPHWDSPTSPNDQRFPQHVSSPEQNSPTCDFFGISIEFINVYFSYPGSLGDNILKGVSFRIAPGSFTGIVGRSGCGKSTIYMMLLRMYEPTSGQILINGRDIREYPVRWLRRRFGYVSQSCSLTAGTIEDNLLLGTTFQQHSTSFLEVDIPHVHASVHPRVNRALSLACADFVATKPLKAKSPITWEGNSIELSGGEQQRLNLARAFMRPKESTYCFLLDEATSALDVLTERKIQRSLSVAFGVQSEAPMTAGHVMEDRSTHVTLVAIAHRLFTLKAADQIIVMDHGKVAEIGGFSELATKKVEKTFDCGKSKKTEVVPGIFAEMVNAQEMEQGEIMSTEPTLQSVFMQDESPSLGVTPENMSDLERERRTLLKSIKLKGERRAKLLAALGSYITESDNFGPRDDNDQPLLKKIEALRAQI